MVPRALVTLVLLAGSAKLEDEAPRTRVIKTKYGQVQGRVFQLQTEVGVALPPVEVFQGIPYATPPVGSNR